MTSTEPLRTTANFKAEKSIHGVHLSALDKNVTPKGCIISNYDWENYLSKLPDRSFDGACILDYGIGVFSTKKGYTAVFTARKDGDYDFVAAFIGGDPESCGHRDADKFAENLKAEGEDTLVVGGFKKLADIPDVWDPKPKPQRFITRETPGVSIDTEGQWYYHKGSGNELWKLDVGAECNRLLDLSEKGDMLIQDSDAIRSIVDRVATFEELQTV